MAPSGNAKTSFTIGDVLLSDDGATTTVTDIFIGRASTGAARWTVIVATTVKLANGMEYKTQSHANDITKIIDKGGYVIQ